MSEILITGITGRIGCSLIKDLEKFLSPGDRVFFLKHSGEVNLPKCRGIDVCIKEDIRKTYDLAIHLAAISDTAYCQKPENYAEVRRANVDLTREVCKAARKVIFLSTDFVFDGNLRPGECFKENDKKNPVNVYGELKSEAEEIVLSNDGIVLRAETMMGTKNRNADAAMAAITGENPKYFPFWTNNSIRPSYYQDFLDVLKAVKDKKGPKIYHVSCSGEALSRLEMAQIILDTYRTSGGNPRIDSLRSCEAPETKTFILGTDKTRQELKVKFTDSREAIRLHVLPDVLLLTLSYIWIYSVLFFCQHF